MPNLTFQNFRTSITERELHSEAIRMMQVVVKTPLHEGFQVTLDDHIGPVHNIPACVEFCKRLVKFGVVGLLSLNESGGRLGGRSVLAAARGQPPEIISNDELLGEMHAAVKVVTSYCKLPNESVLVCPSEEHLSPADAAETNSVLTQCSCGRNVWVVPKNLIPVKEGKMRIVCVSCRSVLSEADCQNVFMPADSAIWGQYDNN